MQLLGSLVFILVCTIELFGAKAYWLQSSIVEGDSATLVLSAKGDSIKFPPLSQIGEYPIASHQSRQSMEFLNGKVSKQIEQYFTFYPDKNVSVPSFELIVDGQKEQTSSLELTVTQHSMIGKNQKEPFSLEMKVSKLNPMQQEGIKLVYIFKRDKDENLLDMKLSTPSMEGFWVKEGEKDSPYLDGNYIVHTINYYIFPQKSGEIKIPKAKIDVARQLSSKEIFMNQIKWKSIVSNDITLHVEPLEGTHLLGDFKMDVRVDKQTIEPNSAVNMTIKIIGEGNFDDIEPFVLNIQGATLFKDEPKIKTFMDGDKLKGEFVQKFSISASQDFVIDPVELKFYSPQDKKIKYIKSEKVDIVFKGQITKEESTRRVSPEIKEELKKGFELDILNFFLGFLGGIFAVVVALFFYQHKKFKWQKLSLSERELLQKLLKYRGHSPEIDGFIAQLEENIYGNAKHPINKKKMKKFLENFVQSSRFTHPSF